ncbi:MAG: hypothetical protein JNL80_05695 [Phycisphaerae bacterium]|nr:hypothetical protein [Phycisphaerae bacterium]
MRIAYRLAARRASRRGGRRDRGVSRVEVLLLIVLLAVIAAVAWPLLQRRRQAGDPIADAKDLTALHAAFVQHANGNGGTFPRPSETTAAPGGSASNRTLDTSANLYSLVLAERAVTPAMLISRAERNPVVAAADYDFGRIDAANGQAWDPGFRTDLDQLPGEGACNSSYVHLALCGERLDHWRLTTDATAPIFGDRATYRGTRSGDRWRKSFTLGRHGQPDLLWGGNLAFADGHIEFLTTFFPKSVTWACGSIKPTKDNVFDCEFDQLDCTAGLGDARTAGDFWLCMTKGLEGERNLVVDYRERLTDGSLPR